MISYSEAHARAREFHMPADCRNCGRKYAVGKGGRAIVEVALRADARHVVTDRNGQRYSEDAEDYEPLCLRCHKTQDRGFGGLSAERELHRKNDPELDARLREASSRGARKGCCTRSRIRKGLPCKCGFHDTTKGGLENR